MRITYISNDRGFLSIHCHEIISHCAKRGHAVTLIMPGDVALSLSLNAAVRQKRIPVLFKNDILAEAAFQALACFSLLISMLSLSRPHLIYARQNYAGLGPIVLARIFKIAYMAEVNGIIQSRGRGFSVRHKVKQILEYACLKNAPAIVVPSAFLRSRIARQFSIPAERISIIPNGVNPAVFFPRNDAQETRAECGFSENDFVVGFIGSMGTWQGIEILKSAILHMRNRHDCSECRFLIAGDYAPDARYSSMRQGQGQGRKDIVSFIADNNLAGIVHYAGFVTYEQSARYMNAADVLVAPYTRAYLSAGGGSPMKLYAYLASGRPAIITDLGDFTDATELAERRAAHLIAPDSAEQLVLGIATLKENASLAKEIAENGREWAIKHRTWAIAADKIAGIYQSLLHN